MQARIVLRIDDLDQDRFRTNYLEDIIETLGYLGLQYERAYSSQLPRMDLYERALSVLREKQQLFACICTRKTHAEPNSKSCSCRSKLISLDEMDVIWKINVEPPSSVQLQEFGKGQVEFPFPLEMAALPVRKKNGQPTYHLASVVDDLHFGITAIVRGVDLLPSSLAQIHLSNLLGSATFNEITFAHHPLLLDGAQKKMSKSSGATSILQMRKRGLSPNEVFTHVAKLAGSFRSIGNLEDLEQELLELWGS